MLGAACLLQVLLLCLFGCTSGSSDTVERTDENTVKAVFSDMSRHVCDAQKLSAAASGAGMSLSVDESLGSIAVSDASSGKLWSALPVAQNTYSAEACAVSAVLTDGKKYYELNSQDNAAAFGTVSCKSISGGTEITYIMAESASLAAASREAADGARLEITVSYTLEDEALRVFSDASRTYVSEGFYLCSLSLLPYFGAESDETAADGDFILLPDGCGALMYTGDCSEARNQSLKTYSDALIPAFGVKQGTGAFAALADEGAAASTVKAEKNTATRCRRAWAEFSFSGADELASCGMYYRFLNGVNADYSSMAAACREHLIRKGMTDFVDDTENTSLPFFITLTGKIKKTDSAISTFKTLTDFDEAEDMLTVVKAKGITNLKVRYSGVLSGGVSQKDIKTARPLLSLGGKSGLKTLAEFAENQNIGLFIDVSLASASVHGGFPSGELYGGKAALSNPMSGICGPQTYEYEVLNTSGYRERLLALLNSTSRLSLTGYCISEAGVSAQADTDEAFAKISTALGAEHKIMVDGGAFCLLKNASYISGLPLSASVANSADYESVPFVQMVLHGSLVYSGTPLNLAENTSDALLKNVEYGACPSVMWNYIAIDEQDKCAYAPLLDETVKLYERLDSELSGLQTMRITDHYELAPGVFVTKYNGEVSVYVNYNDTAVSADGVSIAAKDFIRVG